MTTRRRRDRGYSESVQWALIAPALVLGVVGAVQSGVWLQARTVAEQAASAGAEAYAVSGGGRDDAVAVATRVAAVGDLRSVSVAVTVSGGFVTVRVTGRAPTFLDLGLAGVAASAELPREPS